MSSTATNAGDGESAATTMRFYRSSDVTITPADTLVGTAVVEALGASETARKTLTTTAPSTLGSYYYGACVDAVTGESVTTNNCSPSVFLEVVPADAPDLLVQPPEAHSNTLSAGATFTLSAYVRNLTRSFEATSEETTLRWYSSTDDRISTSDTEVGTDAVPALGALGSSRETVELTAPSTAGIHYYGACVDPVARESSTGNNCSQGVSIIVSEWAGRESRRGAGLWVVEPIEAQVRAIGAGTAEVTVTEDGGTLSGATSVTVTVTPPEEGNQDLEILSVGTLVGGVGNTYPGESFQVAASVLNDGDGPSESTTLRTQ